MGPNPYQVRTIGISQLGSGGANISAVLSEWLKSLRLYPYHDHTQQAKNSRSRFKSEKSFLLVQFVRAGLAHAPNWVRAADPWTSAFTYRGPRQRLIKSTYARPANSF